jgi:hypothetical protein
MWIIDFGVKMPEREAASYEAPFRYVEETVKPIRVSNRRASYAEHWWLHVEPRPGLRRVLAGLPRYLATPILAKHRLFVWLPTTTLPDHQLIVFARDDDYFFGVLQSHIHVTWALGLGTQLETRPRYTPTSTFETFPMPENCNPAMVSVIEAAARSLDVDRNRWLTVSDPNDPAKRTLTRLYNDQPAWLRMDHEALNRAVAAGYGWEWPVPDAEIKARLLALNRSRAAAGGGLPIEDGDGEPDDG